MAENPDFEFPGRNIKWGQNIGGATGVSGTLPNNITVTGSSSIVTVGTITTGTWHATKIGLAYGGTNADLSATGGASQVLQQSGVGATITVGQLAATDITGLAAIATSGSATDLTAGTINTARVSGSYTGITAVGTLTAGTWNATKIGLAYGGTNADLSATGGSNQVLKQSSSGAAITVGTIATTNLSDTTATTTWTPSDQSGASLTFTSVTAIYSKIGNMVYAQFILTYPATASAFTASIGGLPVASNNNGAANLICGSALSGAGAPNSVLIPFMAPNTTHFSFIGTTGGAPTNANLSGAAVFGSILYLT